MSEPGTPGDVCSHGRPDHQEWLGELYEAVHGREAPAMPQTPQQVFHDLLCRIRVMRHLAGRKRR